MPPPTYADDGYFDELYARDPDPWRFATSDYEREKYAATLDSLPKAKFDNCFEIGCSIGVLTRQLAQRCTSMLAVDISERALEQARQRCTDQDWVHFDTMDLRTDWPESRFDLILFSEVLYYLGLDGIQRVARRTVETLSPGGVVVLVNWRGPTDGACTGEEAADLFISACPNLEPKLQQRAEKYRLDVLA